jgi:hypothetical protein
MNREDRLMIPVMPTKACRSSLLCSLLADRVDSLRRALTDTFADPEFLAEADRIGLNVNAPRSGAQLQDVISRAYQSPSRVVERLHQLNNP